MFHSGTQRLMDVWTALPDAGRVPPRAALDPIQLGPLLAQTFMAERRGEDLVFRLAGGWIERLHGRPLRGETWLGLFREDGRALVAAAVAQTVREARPVVIAAETDPGGDPFEIVIAPFRGPDGAADRILGLYQPTRFGGQALRDIGGLIARVSMGVGEVQRAPLQLASLNGRRVA